LTYRTANLQSFILYIYSTNIGTEYFKHGIYSPFLSLQNAVCFTILKYLVPVLFTFYIQDALKLKKNYSGPKSLSRREFSYLKNKNPTRCHLLYLLYFLVTQHVSGINMSIFRSLRLCCWTTTLAEASAGSPDTTLAEPHPNSNTQQSKNNTANVAVQQHSRKLLKMDILMPETCWVSKK